MRQSYLNNRIYLRNGISYTDKISLDQAPLYHLTLQVPILNHHQQAQALIEAFP